MSKSSVILLTFLLIILTTPRASAKEPAPPDHMIETESHELAARDCITISIREVSETMKFVKSILKLKTVVRTRQTTELFPCVEGLILDLTDIKSTLQKLRHLKPMTVIADLKFLEKAMDHAIRLGKRCSHSLYKNVDEIVPSMLTRKLDDLSMVVYDVVYHVLLIERDAHGAGTGGSA